MRNELFNPNAPRRVTTLGEELHKARRRCGQRVHLASATVVCWTHRSSKLIPAASRLLSITLDARTRRERVRSLGCRWRSLVTPAGQPARCGLCEVPPISMLPRRKPPVRAQESRNPRHCTVLKHGRRPSGSRTSSFSSFGNAPGYGTATTAAFCGCGSGRMHGMLCVPRPPLATTGAREGQLEEHTCRWRRQPCLSKPNTDAQLRRDCAFLRTEPTAGSRQGLILSV